MGVAFFQMRRAGGQRRVHPLESILLRSMCTIMTRRMNGRRIPPDFLGIIPFSGYGSERGLHFRGRVVEKTGIVRMDRRDSFIQNARKMWTRFFSCPGQGVTVRVGSDSEDRLVKTTEQGFFRVDLRLERPIHGDSFNRVQLEVVEPKTRDPVRATGPVFVPPRSARMGVISDVDDTIFYAHVTDPIKMLSLLLFSNAATRTPFPGVRPFYRALHAGSTGREGNPFFYISSSSWQMYDVLQDFMGLHDMPPGPIFLRELPLTGAMKDPWHHGHKLRRVREILDYFPRIPFVLIGDSGQRDAEIYSLIVRSFPGRVAAIYIRDVLPTPYRYGRIGEIAERVKSLGSELLLFDHTMAVAEHALRKGWISRESVAEIERDLGDGVSTTINPCGKVRRLPGAHDLPGYGAYN